MGLFDKVAKVGSKMIKDITSDESKEKAKALAEALGEKISDGYKEITSEESKEKAKAFAKAVGQKVSEVTNDVKNYVDDALKEDATEETKEIIADVVEETCDEDVLSKLKKVLAEEFPAYSVKENVSPSTLGGEGKFMNYDLGVYKDEQAVLFIMLIGKTTCSHREYRWSKEVAERNGITMINFIKHYPNELSYIVDRLHKYL